jgi:hypothetical protein
MGHVFLVWQNGAQKELAAEACRGMEQEGAWYLTTVVRRLVPWDDHPEIRRPACFRPVLRPVRSCFRHVPDALPACF